MAFREHSCTRRAILGVAVAVPALVGGVKEGRPSPQPLPQAGEGKSRRAAKWRLALVAFRQAEAELEAFDHWSRKAAVGMEKQAVQALDERFGDYLVAFNAALRRLLRVPAPDLEALAVKIALIVDQDVAGLSGGERCLAVLKADAERLAGEQGRHGRP